MEIVRLNASTLSSPDLLLVPVSAPLILSITFSTLLDSGSSHCFIDPHWAMRHRIPLLPTPPKKLVMIDGSSNAVITQEVRLPLRFACGKVTPFTFFVTPLGTTSPMVLGLNWLTLHNPLVDWALRQITFHTLSPVGVPPTTSS